MMIKEKRSITEVVRHVHDENIGFLDKDDYG